MRTTSAGRAGGEKKGFAGTRTVNMDQSLAVAHQNADLSYGVATLNEVGQRAAACFSSAPLPARQLLKQINRPCRPNP